MMAEHVCGFPLFARLPPEVQYMIWEEALRTPQIVQLCFDFSRYNTTGALRRRVVPPLLQTCAASRQIAQEVYVDDLFEEDRTSVVTYMQSGLDTLYYGSANRGESIGHANELWAYAFPTLDPADVKHVAFEVKYWVEQHEGWDMIDSLRMLIGLETLTLVFEGESEPGRPAELVDLTEDERKNILGTYAPALGFKTVAELLDKIHEDFVTTFDAEEIPLDDIPELRIKTLRGNIFGQRPQ